MKLSRIVRRADVRLVIALLLHVFSSGCGSCTSSQDSDSTPVPVLETPTPEPTPTPVPGVDHAGRISPGDSFVKALTAAEVPYEQANMAVDALEQQAFPFKGLRPGQTFVARVTDDGVLTRLDYQFDRLVRYELRREEGMLIASRIEATTTTVKHELGARVVSSVYTAILDQGGADTLASLVSNLFAWDIDFSTDPRKGDGFRLIFEEERLEDGEFLRYGHLVAGEYDGQKTGKHQGFWFDAEDDEYDGFYDVNGQQLRRTFLRAPLDTMRVTSRYGQRRHPVLGRRTMHHGVDYGAPTGTPVKAVADGRVVSAGRAGAAGKMVKLRHTAEIETLYLHLSRIYVKAGQRVSQGAMIGRVGSTGRSTGPHLDFRVKRQGRYINPQSLKMYSKPAKKLPHEYRAAFEKLMEKMRPQLETIALPPWPPPPTPEPTLGVSPHEMLTPVATPASTPAEKL